MGSPPVLLGDFDSTSTAQPPSLAVSSRDEQRAGSVVKRPIAWMHMPIPRDRNDDAYFAPLTGLKLHPETASTWASCTTPTASRARRSVSRRRTSTVGDYGIATECGWGRRPPETLPELIQIRQEVADLRKEQHPASKAGAPPVWRQLRGPAFPGRGVAPVPAAEAGDLWKQL